MNRLIKMKYKTPCIECFFDPNTETYIYRDPDGQWFRYDDGGEPYFVIDAPCM